MYIKTTFTIASLVILATVAPSADAHGVIESPPSRNQICGVETRPWEAVYGDGGKTPLCKEAFTEEYESGHLFMSVLTHSSGRAEYRSNHVCGFDSEVWNGEATPWDAAMDWPATPTTGGGTNFTWNIEWGPDFYGTEKFRYWITKESFDFKPDQELTWDDFEEKPFCVEFYDHTEPEANPYIVSDVPNSKLHTWCDVPYRLGHHVIYAEWGLSIMTGGRRFHACIDLDFQHPSTRKLRGVSP